MQLEITWLMCAFILFHLWKRVHHILISHSYNGTESGYSTVMLWEFKNNKNTTETVKKISSI